MKYYNFEKPLIIVDGYVKKPFIIEMLSMPKYDSIHSSVVEFRLLDSKGDYVDYIQLDYLIENFLIEPYVYGELLKGYDILLGKHQDYIEKGENKW